jgi:hypothetical protein
MSEKIHKKSQACRAQGPNTCNDRNENQKRKPEKKARKERKFIQILLLSDREQVSSFQRRKYEISSCRSHISKEKNKGEFDKGRHNKVGQSI